MSFLSYNEKVADGDTVILYLGFSRMKQIRVKCNETYQTQFGAVRHNDIIGTVYGSQVKASKGWVYILHPTSELWTVTLPHRTQILYSTDISIVTFQLDLSPGKVVVESGTGSGSLSHALIRSIAPTGHLYTFEFHEQRALQAQEEFREHGFEELVTATHKDVCRDGFGLCGIADAVFLDLPSPWDVIPHAKKTLKVNGGRLCSFSPCIEQVQHTCETLRELGFQEIHTMECLVRDFNIQTTSMATLNLGFENYGEKMPGGEPINDNLMTGQVEPQVGIIVENTDQKSLKRKRKEKFHPNLKNSKLQSPENTENEDTSGNFEKNKLQESKEGQRDNLKMGEGSGRNTDSSVCTESALDVDHKQFKSNVYLCKSSAPKLNIPGHTGYLTFATLFPEFPGHA